MSSHIQQHQSTRKVTCDMKGNTVFLFFCAVFLVWFLEESRAAQAGNDYGVYIVYMGAAASRNGSLRDDHAQLMNSVLKKG